MKIAVIGGTGLIGTKTIAILRAAGHDALAAAPSTGVDTVTGEGLDEALTGAQVVIDLANSPSFEASAVLAFFSAHETNLLAAEARAGVRHHVVVSIVGTDRSPDNGYFRAKLAQEALIKASTVPYTIIRSTQFMEFPPSIAEDGQKDGGVRIATGLFQPIAADDVAAIVAEVALRVADTVLDQMAAISGASRGRWRDRSMKARHPVTASIGNLRLLDGTNIRCRHVRNYGEEGRPISRTRRSPCRKRALRDRHGPRRSGHWAQCRRSFACGRSPAPG